MQKTYPYGFKHYLIYDEYQMILSALLNHPEGITRLELSEELEIPSKSLEKVISKLKNYGIISAVKQYSSKTKNQQNIYYIKEYYTEQLRTDLTAGTA